MQDADDVGQVVQLVLAEELVVQVERAEHHVHLRHVVVVLGVEGVVEAGQFRPRRVDEPQVIEAAGAVNVRQQFLEELQIALAVEDHHRDPVTVLRWPNPAHQILGDDVLQQRCLSAAGHSEHDTLHHANSVRPQPRIAMDVVAEHDRALRPCLVNHLFVPRRSHDERRMHSTLFPPGSAGHVECDCRRQGSRRRSRGMRRVRRPGGW